jgi:pimeloyl-ACP methyl ester carboxylesterase
MPAIERNSRVKSGDVTLFTREFGVPGGPPILLAHGANYYDSRDWIEVAEELATDCETATYDKRGFGESSWSPAKDYSLAANMGDMLAVIDHLGWRAPVVVGHSASGRLSINFAASFPDRVSRLVVVDSGMDHDPGGPRASLGNPPLIFPTVEAAMAHFAQLSNPPRISSDRARAQRALKPVDGGFMLKRDPDFQNTQVQGGGQSRPALPARDIWEALAAVKCPVMIVRGAHSDRYPAEIMARFASDFPHIAWVTADSQHDVAYQASGELVAAIREFVAAS